MGWPWPAQYETVQISRSGVPMLALNADPAQADPSISGCAHLAVYLPSPFLVRSGRFAAMHPVSDSHCRLIDAHQCGADASLECASIEYNTTITEGYACRWAGDKGYR